MTLALTGCLQDPPTPQPTPAAAEQPSPEVARAEARKHRCLDDLVEDADTRHQPLLRSLCAEWVNADIPGVALAVVERQGDQTKLVLHAERGVACFGDDAPVDASTGFRVGSISKVATAALALALVAERSDLSLDGPGFARIPGATLPAGLADPSLDALLRHQSGLGELSPEAVVDADGDWRTAATAQAKPDPAKPDPAKPGFAYSNANYVVVGALLETVTGRDYEQLLRERIAEPLALGSMTSDPAQAIRHGVACGHLAEDPDRHPISVLEDLAFMPGDASWLRPTGGVIASAEDLARFALALGTPALPGSEAMLEPGAPVSDSRGGRDERYGLGLRSWLVGERRVYGHSGDNGSTHAELLFVPGDRAVVILGNAGGGLAATRAAAMAYLGND